jgi:hypothetical protein
MELVENPYISDFTKKTLLQFNWKEGDPIPVTLGERLLEIKATLPTTAKTDVLIDAEQMSPEAIKEVNDMLEAARQLGAKKQKAAQFQKETANMNPQVRAAVEQILGPKILDDRDEPPKKEEKPATPAPAVEKPAEAATIVDATKNTQPLDPPPPQPIQQEPMLILPFCPRCGWDMRQKFDVEVTDRDKEDFVACLLGNTRFKRKYELLGGRLVIVLRSLLAEETKAIYKQLVVDQQANRITTEGEWYAQLMEYRLACSLESTSDKNGRHIAIVPEMQDMPFTPTKENPLDTALVSLLDYVNKKALVQEVTKRLVGTHLRQFQRLVEALEAMALEPSFWNGIE